MAAAAVWSRSLRVYWIPEAKGWAPWRRPGVHPLLLGAQVVDVGVVLLVDGTENDRQVDPSFFPSYVPGAGGVPGGGVRCNPQGVVL